MNLRTILWLSIAVAGLVAALLLTDQKPAAVADPETAVLDGRSLTECTRFGWRFAERGNVEIARCADGRFALTEPIADAASAGHLKSIFDAWGMARMRAVPAPTWSGAAGSGQSLLKSPPSSSCGPAAAAR